MARALLGKGPGPREDVVKKKLKKRLTIDSENVRTWVLELSQQQLRRVDGGAVTNPSTTDTQQIDNWT